MISAFGVDHGEFAKSYIPGKGYKAAARLTRTERNYVKSHVGNQKNMRGKTGTSEQRAVSNAKLGRKRKTIYPDVKTPSGKLTHVVPRAERDELGHHVAGLQGYSLPNGRGGGHIKVYHDAHDPENTLIHEKAHVDPIRNPVRFQDRRLKSDFRSGREEGRADFTANKKPTPGQYPGSRAFQRGYNDSQKRLANATRKPNTFAVDSKGQASRKP